MDNFKIENFKREFPNAVLPEFRSLNESEVNLIQGKLFKLVKLDENSDLICLVNKICGQSLHVISKGAEDASFLLTTVLLDQGIQCDKFVYINWYHFDDIDKFNLKDLNKYFDDIWYPSSDDIDIFDDSFSWVLSIRHDGALSLYRE